MCATEKRHAHSVKGEKPLSQGHGPATCNKRRCEDHIAPILMWILLTLHASCDVD